MKRKLVIVNGQSYWTNKTQPKEKKKSKFMQGLSMVGQGAGIVGKSVGKGVSKAYKNYQEKQAYMQTPEYKQKVLKQMELDNKILKQKAQMEKEKAKIKKARGQQGNQAMNPLDPGMGAFGF